jgi:transaldolase/glucose-6-phosphate isomerase
MENRVMNIIQQMEMIGQSLWYDNIERKKLEDGSILRMIQQGEIKGITSNPSIFEKAIASSKDYDVTLKPMAWAGKTAEEIFWQLAVEDISTAAGYFSPVYEATKGKDGYVSLEVSPLLANHTAATLKDAQKLWQRVGKPNLMIKIPATREGIPAIRMAIAEGINVNVTLIFSIERYADVIEAYLSGLEDRVQAGKKIDHIASVASFFVSRMDTKIDGMLEKFTAEGKLPGDNLTRLSGKAAIANARLAYQLFEEKFISERFARLKSHGAKVQRPLWASTSTKNPNYRDVVYVEELIAPDSVNTLPPATLTAFLDHGLAVVKIRHDLDQAAALLQELESIGISIKKVTDELEDEGVAAFSTSYKSLLRSVENRRLSAIQEFAGLKHEVGTRIASLEENKFIERFFAKDASLWTADPAGQEEIRNRMNWVWTPYHAQENLAELANLATEYLERGFTHAVLLGMGGSSLAPEVISRIICSQCDLGGLKLLVLDSTDPQQVAEIEHAAPVEKTVFIVASKSGTTGEIQAFLDYFWEKVKTVDLGDPGAHFIAITDPGTRLEKTAQEKKFSRVFQADAQVGGRNSALTAFGMVPAALMGIDLALFTQRAVRMADLCKVGNIEANPGFVLGTILGSAVLTGRDKLTLLTGEAWSAFGDWLEQLVAESSGKDGKGMLPVANEPDYAVAQYSDDRLFIRLEQNGEKQEIVDQLLECGHPVISIHVNDAYDLAAQFYLWEVAVATACAVIGVNSFDQPDVQDAKLRTLEGLEAYRNSGSFPEVSVFAQYPKATVLGDLPPTIERRGSLLHLIFSAVEQQSGKVEYVAINAFLPKNAENEQALQELRRRIGDKFNLPTTTGFGPRYLHSTGQFHKGGPNSGLFILLTAQQQHDLEIPGQGVNFGVFQRAQAIGDLQALEAKDRKVIWIDLAEPEAKILLEN